MPDPRPANPPTPGRLLRSFGFAFRGLRVLLATQANARIHAVATVVAVVLGLCVRLSLIEWSCVVVAISLVWTAEAFNTALESIVDLLSPEIRPQAGRAKDLAAGAVLCAAIAAGIVGVLVFGPHLLLFWR